MNIFFIIALIFLSALCAFFSSVLSYLSQEELNKILSSKNKSAQRLYKLKVHFEDSVNVFLFLEIFFYSLSGIIIGWQFYNLIKYELFTFIYIYLLSFLFAIILRTVLFAFGKKYANQLALGITPFLYLLTNLSKYPLKLICFLIDKISGKPIEEASRNEISALFEHAHEEGSIETDEYKILKNIMQFSNVLVSDVMTPRTVIFSCDAQKTVADIMKLPEFRMYSRFPIWEDSLDKGVIGYVMSKDVLYAALKGNASKKLKDFSREVYFIPENAPLDNALDMFLKRRQHLFVVVDEYGGVEGLLTMEDVLETILGEEIVDEADKVVDLREFAKSKRDRRIAPIVRSMNV